MIIPTTFFTAFKGVLSILAIQSPVESFCVSDSSSVLSELFYEMFVFFRENPKDSSL